MTSPPGVENDLPLDNPVDGRGVYVEGTELFGGQHIYKANDKIVECMRESRHLLAAAKNPFAHSYPHCWRHKTPVIFRATPQWFVSLDQNGLRREPRRRSRRSRVDSRLGQATHRRHGAGRPDWCISRQRTWGVPDSVVYVHRETG